MHSIFYFLKYAYVSSRKIQFYQWIKIFYLSSEDIFSHPGSPFKERKKLFLYNMYKFRVLNFLLAEIQRHLPATIRYI